MSIKQHGLIYISKEATLHYGLKQLKAVKHDTLEFGLVINFHFNAQEKMMTFFASVFIER